MTAPIVSPVTVAVGASQHLSFVDQNGAPMPTGADAPDTAIVTNVIFGINPPLANGSATFVIDDDKRGFTVTGVAVADGFVQAKVTKGSVTLSSQQFRVIVPWDVTELGTATP